MAIKKTGNCIYKSAQLPFQMPKFLFKSLTTLDKITKNEPNKTESNSKVHLNIDSFVHGLC